ncbi:MAG TPA: sulfurtransferase TusA family protein [Candidatus Altiarchaeales archaeon]|nr:sulfurtransferase TusA family protein [Candidatus Altiarchaeales archaeon]
MAEVELDTTGLSCPMPIVKMSRKRRELKPGDIMNVISDADGFRNSVQVWCKRENAELLEFKEEGGKFIASVKI